MTDASRLQRKPLLVFPIQAERRPTGGPAA